MKKKRTGPSLYLKYRFTGTVTGSCDQFRIRIQADPFLLDPGPLKGFTKPAPNLFPFQHYTGTAPSPRTNARFANIILARHSKQPAEGRIGAKPCQRCGVKMLRLVTYAQRLMESVKSDADTRILIQIGSVAGPKLLCRLRLRLQLGRHLPYFSQLFD
jgi:hypothetical protein